MSLRDRKCHYNFIHIAFKISQYIKKCQTFFLIFPSIYTDIHIKVIVSNLASSQTPLVLHLEMLLGWSVPGVMYTNAVVDFRLR